jgi:hypothetical protein
MPAELARQRGDHDAGTFVVIAAGLNHRVCGAVELYRSHLAGSPERTSFNFIALEAFVDSIKAAASHTQLTGFITATVTLARWTRSSNFQ